MSSPISPGLKSIGEANTGYRNGVRHALARAAGILGFTGPNWLAELRAYTER
jgi:hypothetical protein